MTVEIDGLDEIEDALDEMLGNAIDLDETNEIPFVELFSPEFMSLYTDFEDIEAFFEASPWEADTNEKFEQIPEEPFDDYVDENTDSPDWEVMQETAGRRYIERQFQ